MCYRWWSQRCSYDEISKHRDIYRKIRPSSSLFCWLYHPKIWKFIAFTFLSWTVIQLKVFILCLIYNFQIFTFWIMYMDVLPSKFFFFGNSDRFTSIEKLQHGFDKFYFGFYATFWLWHKNCVKYGSIILLTTNF